MSEIEQGQPEETAETPVPVAGTDNAEPQNEDKALQAQIDRAVTRALQTQEKRLKRESEQAIEAEKKAMQEKHLQEQGKFQELAEARSAELAALRAEAASKDLQAKTANMLAERNLSGLTALFNADLSTMDGRVEAADMLSKLIDSAAESRVVERLRTPASPRGNAAANSVGAGDLLSQIKSAQDAGDYATSFALKNKQMEIVTANRKPGAIPANIAGMTNS